MENNIEILCLGEPLFELNQISKNDFKSGFGGDVSNVTIGVARQGGKVGFVTRIGKDFFGQAFIEFWQDEKVDIKHVIQVENEDTGLYFITHKVDGHHFTYRRKGSAASFYQPNDLPKSVLENTQVFYASGINLAVSNSMRKATVHAVKLVKASGGLFAFDPNLRTAMWSLSEAREVTHEIMKNCDIALPGLDDARQLTGRDDPSEIIQFYHGLGIKIIALTLGKDGVLVSDGNDLKKYNGWQVPAIDATGAGDCFNGVFLANYCKVKNPFEAAYRANAAAALSTTGYGAVDSIPTDSEITKFLVGSQER